MNLLSTTPACTVLLLFLTGSPLPAAITLTPAGHGHRSLAYAASGQLGELVREVVTGTAYDGTRLLYRGRLPGAAPGAWEEVLREDVTYSNTLTEAALTFNTGGQPEVLYLTRDGRFRQATRSTGGGWSTAREWLLPTAYGSLSMESITYAFEPDGTPHLLLLLTDFPNIPLLVHARLATPATASQWTTLGGPFTRPTSLGAFDYPGFDHVNYVRKPRHLSLARDGSGGLHAIYSVNQTSVAISGGTEVRSSLFYLNRPAGGAWSAPLTLLSPGTGFGDGGLGASLAIAPDGTVAVAAAYLPRANTGSPGVCSLNYLVRQSNGTWTSSVVSNAADNYQAGDGARGTGLEPQLVFNDQSSPAIGFTDHASEHFPGSGASSFSGQVRLATRSAATTGAWTLSKPIGRGSLIPMDFLTFRPAVASRYGQTAAAATTWSWNNALSTYQPSYQVVLSGTLTVPPPPALAVRLELLNAAAGQANLRLHLNRPASYTLQATANPATGPWQNVRTGTVSPPSVDLSAVAFPSPKRGFFRVAATLAP